MALPVFTAAQIIAQLNSTHHWSGSTITFSTSSTAGLIAYDSNTASVDYGLETTTYTPLNTNQAAAATLAVNLWGDLMPEKFVAVNEGTGTNANIDLAGFADNPTNGDYAYTLPYYNGTTNALVKSSVWVNDSFNAANGHVNGDLSNPQVDNYSFLTFMHELGHAIGLDHAGNYNGTTGSGPSSYQDSLVYSIMSYYGPSSALGGQNLGVAWANWGGYDPQTPMLDDVLAIQSIYGVSPTTRNGDTTYGFGSNITGAEASIYNFALNAHPIMCIFDSSGTDTLNLSGDANNDMIDLHSGAFSSVMGLTNNLSIAYSSTIENAIGGTGNDTIIGNGVANVLSGGAGDDTLLGGDGMALNTVQSSVYRLYQAALNREPDVAGLQNWEASLNAGQSLAQVTTGFINSQEFQSTYGGLNNTQFVTLLYNNVLHRVPDASGLASWVNTLNTGTARAVVVDGFSESTEFQNNSTLDSQAYATTAIGDHYLAQIYRLYETALNRAPDIGGFQNWIGAMQGGQSLGQVTSSFVGSAEFQTTYGTLDNTQFVTLLYNNVLHRAADVGGLASWVNLLNAGSTRATVADGFSESAEFINASNSALTAYVQNTMAPIWSDVLNGGPGNDKLFGGLGSDTFQFQTNGGVDHVYGFEAWDHVQLAGFGYANAAAALSQITQVGQDTVFIDQGESITFHHTLLAMLQDTAGIFILA